MTNVAERLSCFSRIQFTPASGTSVPLTVTLRVAIERESGSAGSMICWKTYGASWWSLVVTGPPRSRVTSGGASNSLSVTDSSPAPADEIFTIIGNAGSSPSVTTVGCVAAATTRTAGGGPAAIAGAVATTDAVGSAIGAVVGVVAASCVVGEACDVAAAAA